MTVVQMEMEEMNWLTLEASLRGKASEIVEVFTGWDPGLLSKILKVEFIGYLLMSIKCMRQNVFLVA